MIYLFTPSNKYEAKRGKIFKKQFPDNEVSDLYRMLVEASKLTLR